MVKKWNNRSANCTCVESDRVPCDVCREAGFSTVNDPTDRSCEAYRSVRVCPKGELSTTVVVLNSGIRIVVHNRDGEWWNRYVIIPRELCVKHIQRRRAKGKRIGDFEPWETYPSEAADWIGCQYYGGPGRGFSNEPFRARRAEGTKRRFVIIDQTGGLDI